MKRLKRVGDRSADAHDNDLGLLVERGVHELIDDHGGAVVQVGRAGEVEYDDFVLRNIRGDHRDQPVGGGDREGSPERHQTDSCRKRVGRGQAVVAREELPVQHRHRDHAVQLQALQPAGVGYARGDQSDRHGGDQIDEQAVAPDRLRSDACVELRTGEEVPPGIVLGPVGGGRYAVYWVQGPYEGISRAYGRLFGESGYRQSARRRSTDRAWSCTATSRWTRNPSSL